MATYTVEQIAREVIAGKWGNGDERRRRLEAAGYNYWTVQNEVNRLVGTSSSSAAPNANVTAVARQVIAGQWGNGEERRRRLEAAGYDYWTVQNEVNRLIALGALN